MGDYTPQEASPPHKQFRHRLHKLAFGFGSHPTGETLALQVQVGQDSLPIVSLRVLLASIVAQAEHFSITDLALTVVPLFLGICTSQ